MIDWLNFTPWQSLLGGGLLGLSAGLFILLNGRIAGISGMLGAALTMPSKQQDKLYFLLGMLLAPTLLASVYTKPEIIFNANYVQSLVAGVLVGIGVYLASGCTSGHGICGLSRFSKRSIMAVISFMLTGILTTYILRHVL
ncbi:YeeE/YedE family protein [Pseudomonas sp. F1_0610]|uniref:YeeE/YedE family protein n=1 Tax=Pseudomonas sp. F1_0610 TaxID=3114284 RepID=UPI0039C2DE2B